MSGITTKGDGLSVLPYMHRRMAKFGRAMGFSAAAKPAHQRWKKGLLKRLREITGYDTMTTCPLKPEVTERVACDGYTRERVLITTEPGVVMTLYVLTPDPAKHPQPATGYPAIICAHGHASGGKYSPAGRTDIPAIAPQVKEYNYDYGVQFARLGCVTFCPDARGFGERREPSLIKYAGDNLLASSCQYINQMAFPLGQTVTGMWAWDLHRLIDYIETRKECDPKRIGCVGLSGGGLQTLWATALDEQERIKAAVISGYYYGYQESLLEMHQNCSCNYVPHLYETADMGDIGALIAPRPLLIETGDEDPLNGPSKLDNVHSQVAITRKAYKLLGATTNLVHDVFPGGHKWSGKVSVPWMVKQLA